MGCRSAADTRTTEGSDRGTSSWRQVQLSSEGDSQDEEEEEEEDEKEKKKRRWSRSGRTGVVVSTR